MKRFAKYSNAQISLNKKRITFTILGSIFAVFIITLISLFANKNNWTDNNWFILFLLIGIAGIILLSGNSFHFLRKKETQISTFMIPASIFEKFTYEFIIKLLYTILYPLAFIVIAHTSTSIAQYFNNEYTYPYFSLTKLISLQKVHLMVLYFFLYISGTTLLFAGASAFKRYPLPKTIIFLGLVILIIIGYFYFIFAELNLKNGIQYILEHTIGFNDKIAIKWFNSFLGVTSIVALFFTYYNLKEKEA